MSTQIKSKKVTKVGSANGTSRKLVLAGLGAVSLVQKQGRKAIDALIAEGEGFRARAHRFVCAANNDARKFTSDLRKRVAGYFDPIRANALGHLEQVEQALAERVGAVLGRFGVPSKGEVQELLVRVAELNKEIRGGSRRVAR